MTAGDRGSPTPPALANRDQAGRGRRRHLTILFADLSGSTRLSAAMEPEIFSDLLARLRALCADVAARHGGEIVRIDGDGMICIFGHPTPVEDGGRRAAEAAIDIHHGAALLDAEFAAADRRIRMHSGVHSGVVLVSTGDLVRGRYEILGDATNLAAHLCELAEPGEILVSEAALGPDLGFFQTGPRRLVSPRGARQPMGAYRVTGRTEAPRRFDAWARRSVAPFAGREAELSRLFAAQSAVEAGRKAAHVVAGAPGMGKTRLVSEFLLRLSQRGRHGHRGYCEAYLGAASLQPIGQIVGSILVHDHGIAPARLDTLLGARDAAALSWLVSDADGGARDAGPGLVELTAAVLRLIDLQPAPLTFCIDDWQWADDASKALFGAILRDARRPIFAILASRSLDPIDSAPIEAEQLRLSPLTSDEARQTIGHILADRDLPQPSRFLVDRIVERAGGCPLFIEELSHAAQENDLEHVASHGGLWLDSLIQSRFAAMPDELAAIVTTASVIGHMIPRRLLEGVTGRAIDDALVARLSDADFIYPGELPDTLRFKHGLTRDAIYRVVGLDERRGLHARVVEWLLAPGEAAAGPGEFELLSYHCAASGDIVRAASFAMAAGHRAMAASALDRAQAQYLAAFQAYKALAGPADSPVPLADVVASYGRACVVDPSRDQTPYLQEMVAMAREDRDAKALALALYWLGSIRYGLGEAGASIALLSEALPIARDRFWPGLAAQIGAGLGQSWFDAGQCARAETLLDEAIAAMAANLSPPMMPAYLYAIGDRAQIFAERGDFGEAERGFADVTAIIGDDQPAVLCSLLTKRAGACIWKGDYAGALAFANAAESHGLRDHSRINVMIAQALGGYATFLIGESDCDAAAARLVDAVKWLEAASHGHRISLFYGWASDAMATLGDVAATRHFAARAFRRSRVGDGFGEGSAARALARLAPGRAGRRGADAYLAIAYRSADRRDSPRARAETSLCEAEIALAAGDEARARQCGGVALDAFRTMDMRPHIGRAETLLGAISSR
ncbi:MAG: ATP-binding protein [Sphingopyxis sp.]|uniref:ATP-binding protein n=1 Tax=Sphingopyxis sp. TaxID=1908224 RepID=UPI003D6CC363